ncbi:hypothetical protein AB4Z21_09070, partial [Paenibacillus sp. MCAF20]
MRSEDCLTNCAKQAFAAHLSEVHLTRDEIKLTKARIATSYLPEAVEGERTILQIHALPTIN